MPQPGQSKPNSCLLKHGSMNFFADKRYVLKKMFMRQHCFWVQNTIIFAFVKEV
tara:strand:+ start:21365 stop:21526 length:162 start_codon:yes stop_codon:yes gene_type:complete